MKKVLAFDIGGTNTRLSLVNEKYEIEKQLILPTKKENVEDFVDNCFKVVDELNVDLNEIIAVGCGLPGVIDVKNNTIIDLPHVGIKNVPLGEMFEKKYNKKIYLRNDAEVAALAEANLGAGRKTKRTFFITISTGLGGALCVDGFNQDYVTEIGHTFLVYKDKVVEYEQLLSGSGIPNLCALNNAIVKDSLEFFNKVKEHDETIMPIYEEWLSLLTEFLHMVQNSYYPDIICFTGGVFKNKNIFFEELQKRNPNSKLVECIYKEDAGTIGAAIYAFQCSNVDKI